ncbi:hypothetical protein LIER_43798 [Lithospermum erythrorhizon]|uniref:Uncharacterized protein n=1 Tax=Lithospermum erythrorhizon TaxID=34254 RepID=A0AAV3QW39_LITER
MEEKNRTAPKVLDVLPQQNKPSFSALSSSSLTAGLSRNHGRKVKYTQVWRENKDTCDLMSRRQVLNSKGKELLTENSFGPLELIASDFVVVAAGLESADSPPVDLRDRGNDHLPNLRDVNEESKQVKISTQNITGDVKLGSLHFHQSKLDDQAAGSDSLVATQVGPLECVTGLAVEAPQSVLLPALGDGQTGKAVIKQAAGVTAISDGANQHNLSFVAAPDALSSGPKDDEKEKNLHEVQPSSIEQAGIQATGMEYSAPIQQILSTNLKLQQISYEGNQNNSTTKKEKEDHSTPLCGQLRNPAAPRQIQNVTGDGILGGEVKQTWGDRMEAHDQQFVREQSACIAFIKDHTTTSKPGKANFSERVAQKEHNEGLPLKNKTSANVGITHQTTEKENEYTQKKIEQNVIETFSRRASHDDSEVDENRPTQDNPQTDLPPEILMAFICPKGIEISMNEYQDAGYRLIARRSLSPTGRSSSKLTSLRKKVENIQICEEKTSVKDLQEYSKEYQEDIEQARRPKITNQSDKHPSPNGPGQSRQRRNRGRNRGYHGTPDRSLQYHVPGRY